MDDRIDTHVEHEKKLKAELTKVSEELLTEKSTNTAQIKELRQTLANLLNDIEKREKLKTQLEQQLHELTDNAKVWPSNIMHKFFYKFRNSNNLQWNEPLIAKSKFKNCNVLFTWSEYFSVQITSMTSSKAEISARHIELENANRELHAEIRDRLDQISRLSSELTKADEERAEQLGSISKLQISLNESKGMIHCCHYNG